MRSPVAGRVEFAGDVAGRLYVVVLADRSSRAVGPAPVKVTVGWMESVDPGLASGQPVAEGERIGSSGPATHLSVRVNGVHVEPLAALGLGWARLRGAGGVLVGRRPLPR